jgi:Tol biopolymer transport system component
MAAPFNVAELTVTGDPVPLLEGVRHPSAQTAADYAVSASGTLVYVPGAEETVAGWAVVWVDRNGKAIERALSELVANARDPRLSPDGRRLMLTTGAFNDGDLWIYDLDGRPPIPLAVAGDNRNAVFSPDGAQIAFVRAAAANSNVYVTPADGSVRDPQPLRSEGILGAPGVWANGDDLIVVLFRLTGGFSSDIVATLAAPAGEIHDVVVTDDEEFDPALSPNDRWLAYVSNRTGENEIWVKRYPDGVPVRVSRSGGYEPRWSADGRELFYLQGSSMMAVAVEAEDDFSFGAGVQLFDASYLVLSQPFVRTYDVARDGRFLMIESDGGTAGAAAPSSFVVVQNWAEELKQRVPVGN